MDQRGKIADVLEKITLVVEIIVSIFILIVVCILMVETIIESNLLVWGSNHWTFDRFLSSIYMLVIGIEFVKMLCRHTPESIVDVLLFATARQVVLNHTSSLETLLGVVAIGVLFIIKKYLFSAKKVLHLAKNKKTFTLPHFQKKLGLVADSMGDDLTEQ